MTAYGFLDCVRDYPGELVYQKGKTWKVKPIWISWSKRYSEWHWHQLGICESASHPRHITVPASHHSFFYMLDALPAAQPTASKP